MNFEESFYSDISNSGKVPLIFKSYEEFIKCKDITDYIYDHKRDIDDRVKINIVSGSIGIGDVKVFRIIKYDPFIIILDNLKKIFKISYTPKREIIIKGQRCLIMECENEQTLKNFERVNGSVLLESPKFVKEIQRIFAFKYLMCLSCIYENKIDVRTMNITSKVNIAPVNKIQYLPVSYRECSYLTDFDATGNRIPKTIIEKWFENDMIQETKKDLKKLGNSSYYSIETSMKNKEINLSGSECLYNVITELVSMIDINEFKILLQDLITERIKAEPQNPKIRELFWWSNAVFERFRQF